MSTNQARRSCASAPGRVASALYLARPHFVLIHRKTWGWCCSIGRDGDPRTLRGMPRRCWRGSRPAGHDVRSPPSLAALGSWPGCAGPRQRPGPGGALRAAGVPGGLHRWPGSGVELQSRCWLWRPGCRCASRGWSGCGSELRRAGQRQPRGEPRRGPQRRRTGEPCRLALSLRRWRLRAAPAAPPHPAPPPQDSRPC